jgi:hypothetical protein
MSASRTGRLYPLGNIHGTHFHLGLSRPYGHGAVGRNISLKNPVTPPVIDPGTVRLVAQLLNHYASSLITTPPQAPLCSMGDIKPGICALLILALNLLVTDNCTWQLHRYLWHYKAIVTKDAITQTRLNIL